jgi:hypothetical protein
MAIARVGWRRRERDKLSNFNHISCEIMLQPSSSRLMEGVGRVVRREPCLTSHALPCKGLIARGFESPPARHRPQIGSKRNDSGDDNGSKPCRAAGFCRFGAHQSGLLHAL